MRAAIRQKYGAPEVLNVAETANPSPKENELLVKVRAATVNRSDCSILTGTPFIIRLFAGLFTPKLKITGTDFAGIVEATGKKVTMFRPGDRVFGFDDNGLASHAEYLTIEEDKPVSLMPEGYGFSQAAASIEGAHYAINFMNKVRLQPGQKVLVNGATGAIGSAAVQLLKFRETFVTAVCEGKNFELVKSLGADKLIDYTSQDFTQDDEKYDFVFDAVGKSTFGKCKSLLKDKGIYISSELGPGAQNVFYAISAPLSGGKKVRFPLPTNIKGSIAHVRELADQEKFKPLIDREYALDEIVEAYRYVASGRKKGNVVLVF